MKGPQLVVVGKLLLRVTVIIAWYHYQSWFTSANHYKKKKLIANVLTLALDMFVTHIEFRIRCLYLSCITV